MTAEPLNGQSDRVNHQPHVLDNPAYAALTGPHAFLAEWHGGALRYPVDVAPYAALPGLADSGDWADLATLAGRAGQVRFAGAPAWAPDGWQVTRHARLQMIDASVSTARCDEAVRLSAADVPDMLNLAASTEPGPFLPGAIELGTYLGIYRNGTLVAMAGERLHPPDWAEISAVCTRAEYRGQGLARELVSALVTEIRSRGESAFLHVSAGDRRVVGLYESLGFQARRLTTFIQARVPEMATANRLRADGL